MAVEIKEKVICPKCGEETEVAVRKSLNTRQDPDVKQKIMDRSMFRFHCPKCGQQIFLNYSFLYHQVEDRMMIYYAPDSDSYQEAKDAFDGNFKVNGVDPMLNPQVTELFQRRIVRDLNVLCEKIEIRDAGLDDRVIELMKVAYGSMMQTRNPEQKVQEMLFFRKKDGGYAISFLNQGKGFASVDFSRKVYDTMEEEFRDLLPASPDDPQYDIGFAWAMELYRRNEERKEKQS